MLVIHIDRI